MKYKPTIGLEIHAELKTKTKMFCNSKNDPDEKKPNVNACPICMGHPGTLPVINKEAVKHILKVGVALGGELADITKFDRKNYFYPDIPKGYQISQYKYPLVKGGTLLGVDITRVHLEEDTARSSHEHGHYSLIDFNRSGIPLMELVTEPVIESGEQALNFARELQLLLRYLKAGDANMEKGEMRVEANVSVSASSTAGTKVEVKNLNSFRSVERAINYEIKRQTKLLNDGELIVQETRGWDEDKQMTVSQRIKEESHDYRYFPDPDIPSLHFSLLSEFEKEKLNKEIPELPWQKRERYIKSFGISQESIEVYIRNNSLSNLFESVIANFNNNRELIKIASNYIISDVVGLINGDTQDGQLPATLTPDNLSMLAEMILGKEISSRGAKEILRCMIKSGEDARSIAEERDLFQKSNGKELTETVKKIVSENKKVASDYKGGKESAIQFLIGQGMKATNGSANPETLRKLFIEELSA
jgi:aspartyl-tRNA(Asn)/glutamyl-tRNA(Gln) amidotransferase subunit B